MAEETPPQAPPTAEERLPDWAERLPSLGATIRAALLVLAFLAVVYSVALGRGLLLPIILALLLSIVLRPFVSFLARLGLPRMLGAVLVLLLLASAVLAGLFTLAEPVSEWLRRLPDLTWKLEQQLAALKTSIEEARQLSRQVSELAQGAGEPERVVVEEGSGLIALLLDQLQQFSITIAATAVLLFFLLAEGRERLQRMITAVPDRDQRYQWREAVGQVRDDIALYLRTVTLINLGLGAITTGAMVLVGLPNAPLWGVLAAVANFLPYIGPLAVTGLIGSAALLTFDTWPSIVLPPAVFLVLSAIEGQFVTPMILGKRLMIDPIAVFIAVLFWGWIWGIPGALLAVPILTIFKIFCDHLEALRHFRPLLR